MKRPTTDVTAKTHIPIGRLTHIVREVIVEEVLACDACRSRRLESFGTITNRISGLGPYPLVRCAQCGLVFLNPRPTFEEMATFYSEGYYSTPNAQWSFSRAQRVRNLIHRQISQWYYSPMDSPSHPLLRALALAVLAFYGGGCTCDQLLYQYPSGSRVLDVGCGSGHWLFRAREQGYDTYGVEPSPAGAQIARSLELNVIQGDIFSAQYPDQFFDLIRAHHVFEHLHQPAATLAELGRILRPDGLILMMMPSIGGLNFRIFGQDWAFFDVPRHLYYFSPTSIRVLCNRLGLKVVALEFNSGSLGLVGSLYSRLRRAGKPVPRWLVNSQVPRLLTRHFMFLVDRLVQGDVLEVAIARSG
jgi:SAM-dependent methyltransferase